MNMRSNQKSVIDNTIKYALNDIIQTFLTEPETAQRAIEGIFGNISDEDKKIFTEKNVLDSIDFIKKILDNPHPIRLLNLFAENVRNWRLTDTDVHTYLREKLNSVIQQFKNMDEELLAFIKENENSIKELMDCSDRITLQDIVTMGKNNLQKLIPIPNPYAIDRLLSKVEMPLFVLLNLDDATRKEFLKYSLEITNLKELAHIGYADLLSLSPEKRTIFFKDPNKIISLLGGTNPKSKFEELQLISAANLPAFIDKKLLEPTPAAPQSVVVQPVPQSTQTSEIRNSYDDINDFPEFYDVAHTFIPASNHERSFFNTSTSGRRNHPSPISRSHHVYFSDFGVASPLTDVLRNYVHHSEREYISSFHREQQNIDSLNLEVCLAMLNFILRISAEAQNQYYQNNNTLFSPTNRQTHQSHRSNREEPERSRSCCTII